MSTLAVTQDDIVKIVSEHLAAVDNFDAQLDNFIAAGRDYGGFVSRIQRRVASFKEWIETAEENCHVARDREVGPWAVAARREAPSKVVLTGPAADDEEEVETENEDEADYLMSDHFIGMLAENCQMFHELETLMVQLIHAYASVKDAKANLGVPADEAVQSHIRLLKQYNDVKDVGQQLIGLIAENRGVPIKTLYENGDYGVTAED
ncbi:Swi5-domain-containing protein [Cercophora newfieldiana]|uniref:Swi5-domain-containing protein n=1 Tax=Cercophora newfieldiana TaxID=92897 RepID=A0AA40CXB6_9PEZI|nr:Swi5-domain-containing protein [Cercophora newfieldiana]